ncbi:MAG TPA: TonB-dependent receptor [Chitinophagaceae bacterium]|nr:TonB-dependent receptor [Chitinophagaceae bacterium]
MKYLFSILSFLYLYSTAAAQPGKATLSGSLRDAGSKSPLSFANITLKAAADSAFTAGTISGEDGRFSLPDIKSGNYVLIVSITGYLSKTQPVLIGQLSNFLDLGNIELEQDSRTLSEVTVSGKQETISSQMDKKTFTVAGNISQAGGSVLEAMKNLPGITAGQDGKVLLRGSDKVMILIDGKQTALTGFGGQSGLDNIPASAIEKIEIINNPSSRYDAAGNAGIINIIYKKEKKQGFNGKIGLAGGAGALWIKKENYPGIRPQYHITPKINPSLSLNYRKDKVNLFFQGDNLYTKTLNKNEFVDRFYDNGDTVKQQTKRNRTTNIVTTKLGMDWFVDASNTFTVSGLFSSEKILDRGDEPFFNGDFSQRLRLWQFLEDELKTTATASASWQHRFKQPGRLLSAGINYTFHREDEKYFFTNFMPSYTGLDSFKLLSDEHVTDLTVDYVHPLKQGRFEAGLKFRRRYIPVNMQFKPGVHSPLDSAAGGYASYGETIPAAYGNYIYENEKLELEAGLRVEYVNLDYYVNPNHPVYKSDGYHYFQPFPNLRIAYKINDRNKLSFFYNRRVDRPNEVDIRIFPKYDDAEIIKVGNPALRPQFTNNYELGYRTGWNSGYLFSSVYHKRMKGTITRIGSVVPGSDLIYNIFQNAGKSYSTGIELLLSQNIDRWLTLNINMNGYQNIIDSFSVLNKYPSENLFTAAKEDIFSGNIKFNALLHFANKIEGQFTAIYQAPDLVPQGKTYSRFSIDLGLKKSIQKGNGEIFINATDVANTMRLKKEVNGNGFRYISSDYYETQVVRLGYNYKF